MYATSHHPAFVFMYLLFDSFHESMDCIGNRELQRYLLDEGRRAELEACIRARELRGFVTLANFSQIALT